MPYKCTESTSILKTEYLYVNVMFLCYDEVIVISLQLMIVFLINC